MKNSDNTNFLSDRRDFLAMGATLIGASLPATVGYGMPETPAPQSSRREQFRIGFNTATILDLQLPAEEEIEIIAQAGFRFAELWSMRISDYLARGKSLAELKKRLDDLGLQVESLIGFSMWMADDIETHREGMETMQREMDWVTELGGHAIAACGVGERNKRVEIPVVIERYTQVLELGKKMGIRPMLELWGRSPTLSQLSDCLAVATATKMENASLLLDAFHLYRGNNSFDSLQLVGGAALPIFHINDYPAEPQRDELADHHRIYPGDGICPLEKILQTLAKNGFNGTLSLELFNRDYHKTMTPAEIVQQGYVKMQQLLERAFP